MRHALTTIEAPICLGSNRVLSCLGCLDRAKPNRHRVYRSRPRRLFVGARRVAKGVCQSSKGNNSALVDIRDFWSLALKREVAGNCGDQVSRHFAIT